MSSLSFSIFQSQFMSHKPSHKFDGPITWLYRSKGAILAPFVRRYYQNNVQSVFPKWVLRFYKNVLLE